VPLSTLTGARYVLSRQAENSGENIEGVNYLQESEANNTKANSEIH
jgi:hypothetical protein